MTRDEHMQWAKKRAINYIDTGMDLDEVMTGFHMDLKRHDELANHAAIELGFMQQMSGLLNTKEEIIKWIEGCV